MSSAQKIMSSARGDAKKLMARAAFWGGDCFSKRGERSEKFQFRMLLLGATSVRLIRASACEDGWRNERHATRAKEPSFIGGQKAAPCAAFCLDVFRMSGQEAGELA